jgi:nucleotidyltransferase substrate binding protein (TIGR01987 family)
MSDSPRLADFRRAVVRLGEALAAGDADPLYIDAAIQRFEFSAELAWKCLQEVLRRDHGVEVASPKPALQQAYRLHLIDDEAIWLDLWRDRNLTSHTYREALAREIHARLPGYLAVLRRLAERL